MSQRKQFQKYVIKDKIRSVGAYMDVYLATQPGLERDVELRILSRAVEEGSSDYQRFKREFRLLARLDHPGVIQILDLGCHANRLYYITTFRNAKSLEQLMLETESPFSVKEVVTIGLVIGDAIRHMHLNNLLHRNISTHTIFYDLDNLRPYIADFVTLKASADGSLSKSEIPFVYDSFFTPEQIFNRPIDRRTDLYLLGAAMYRLLTMKVPFEKKALLRSDLESAFAVSPPTSFNEKVPVGLEVIVMKLLEVEAENRYQDCDEFLLALEAVRDILRR